MSDVINEMYRNHPDFLQATIDEVDRRKESVKGNEIALEKIKEKRNSIATHRGSTIDIDQPPDPFIIDGWIPANKLSIITGTGALGKTTFTSTIAAAIVSDNEIPMPYGMGINADYRKKTVVFVTYEEPVETIVSRAGAYMRLHGCTSKRAEEWGDRMQIIDLTRDEPLYAESRTSGAWTITGHAVLDLIADIKPSLVIIDPVAAAYWGDENNRKSVRDFVGYLNGWARMCNCAVLLTMHPPKRGAIYSGSTDWRNACRAMIDYGELPKDDYLQYLPSRYKGKEGAIAKARAEGRKFAYVRVDKINNAKEGTPVILELVHPDRKKPPFLIEYLHSEEKFYDKSPAMGGGAKSDKVSVDRTGAMTIEGKTMRPGRVPNIFETKKGPIK